MFNRWRYYHFITILCLLFSASLLAAGYLLAGFWQIVLVFPFALLFWVIAKSRPGISVPSVLLGSYIFLASLGVWIGFNRYLMVYGFILALAGWELRLFQTGLTGDPQHSNIELLEKNHLNSLSIVIILSLFVTTIGLNVRLSLPFGVILFLVLLVGILLERIYFSLTRGGS